MNPSDEKETAKKFDDAINRNASFYEPYIQHNRHGFYEYGTLLLRFAIWFNGSALIALPAFAEIFATIDTSDVYSALFAFFVGLFCGVFSLYACYWMFELLHSLTYDQKILTEMKIEQAFYEKALDRKDPQWAPEAVEKRISKGEIRERRMQILVHVLGIASYIFFAGGFVIFFMEQTKTAICKIKMAGKSPPFSSFMKRLSALRTDAGRFVPTALPAKALSSKASGGFAEPKARRLVRWHRQQPDCPRQPSERWRGP